MSATFVARRFMPMLAAVVFAGAALCGVTPALAVMLVELKIDATARPYNPDNPLSSAQQDFSVPDAEGQLIVTYTEDRYVGGPGGFTYDPVDLSPEYLGWGGSAEYTPRDPVAGQPFKVVVTYQHSYSKKMWRATLTARHDYQAFQIRDRGQQFAGTLTLTIEFIPKSADPITAPQTSTLEGTWQLPGGNMTEIFADGTGHDSRGNTMTWTLLDAARGIYELHWSHGYTDKVTLAPDGKTMSGVNNTGFHWDAVRRGPPPAIETAELTGSWDWGPGSGLVDMLADGTGHDSNGNTLRWTLGNAASRIYVLVWSHGFVDLATLSEDGKSLVLVSNTGAQFSAVRRGGV
ncbi:MAG: hypothetical protein HZB20_00350 [Chloroflexi bacterium]|nr:hypothetical protein [Chloroflexota bacterium]